MNTMNKKLIALHAIILALLIGFVVISITIYYLIPAGESAIDYVRKAIEELINVLK